MQEQYVAFFLRHIVLNCVVWLKLKHVFRSLRRMFRHNDLKDSLSQMLHFILQFILIVRKPPPQRLPGSVSLTGMLALLPGCIMCGGRIIQLTKHPSWPMGSRMMVKIYLDKIFQILTFSDPVTEQDRKLLLFKMLGSYFQLLKDFLIPDRIYKHPLQFFFSSCKL